MKQKYVINDPTSLLPTMATVQLITRGFASACVSYIEYILYIYTQYIYKVYIVRICRNINDL